MTSHIRRSLPALMVIAVLGVSACGKSDPLPAAPGAPAAASNPAGTTPGEPQTGPAVDDIDPCALVTKEEATVLAGTPVDPAVRVRETCTYTAPVTGPTGQVEVYVGDGAKKQLDIDRDLGHEFVPVPGAGDEGWYEDGSAFVRKGNIWVSVRLVRLNDPAENKKPLTDAIVRIGARI